MSSAEVSNGVQREYPTCIGSLCASPIMERQARLRQDGGCYTWHRVRWAADDRPAEQCAERGRS